MHKTTHSGCNIASNIGVTYAKKMTWHVIKEDKDKWSNIIYVAVTLHISRNNVSTP